MVETPRPTRPLYHCAVCRNYHALSDYVPEVKRKPYICVKCMPLRADADKRAHNEFIMDEKTRKVVETLRGLKRKDSPISFQHTAALIEGMAAEIHRLRELIAGGYVVVPEGSEGEARTPAP